jgi:hypothetical protein
MRFAAHQKEELIKAVKKRPLRPFHQDL